MYWDAAGLRRADNAGVSAGSRRKARCADWLPTVGADAVGAALDALQSFTDLLNLREAHSVESLQHLVVLPLTGAFLGVAIMRRPKILFNLPDPPQEFSKPFLQLLL